MTTLKGNQIKAADSILKTGFTHEVVYLPSLLGKGLRTESDLTIEEIESAGKFLESNHLVTIHKSDMGIGYKLTDIGNEFVESGNTTRDLITKLENETIKNHTDHLAKMEIERQDKELGIKSNKVSIIGRKEANWIGIIGIILTIIFFVIDKCDTQ